MYRRVVASSPEALEQRIDQLRAAVRHAATAGDRAQARELRAQLRAAESDWDNAVAELERQSEGAAAQAQQPAAVPSARPPAGPLLPVREQVHQALTLVGVAAAPRLIVAVHDAFFSRPLIAARLTSLRRDEERSFRSAPYARAYYLSAALTADLLAPARGLLAVSTWPLERRVIGPLSPRVDYLTAAIAVADSVRRLPGTSADADRLLWRFAVNIPGAQPGGRRADPETVARAAHAELGVHAAQDEAHRQAAAARARAQLDDAEQLFGSRLQSAGGAMSASS
jgi:hypothetical protein